MINYSERELKIADYGYSVEILIDKDIVGSLYSEEDQLWRCMGATEARCKREAIASLLHWHGLDCPNIMHQLDELVPQEAPTSKGSGTAFGKKVSGQEPSTSQGTKMIDYSQPRLGIMYGGDNVAVFVDGIFIGRAIKTESGWKNDNKNFIVRKSLFRAIKDLLIWHKLDGPSAREELTQLLDELASENDVVSAFEENNEAIAELEQIDRTAGDGSAPNSNPENKIITVLLKKEENDVIEIYLEMKTRNAYAGLIRKRRDTYPWDGFNSNSIEITSNWATRLEAIQSLLAKSHAWEDRFKVTIEEQLNAFSQPQPQPQRRSLDFATAEPGQAIVIEFSGNKQIKDQLIKTTICSVHSEEGDHTAYINLKGITLSCHRSGGWARLSNNMRIFEEDGFFVLLTGDVKTEDGKEELDFQCNVYPL
jgi:hypothetical protein